MPGSRTILATIGFSKAFDSDWHPALFHKLILAGLPCCFARWTEYLLSDRRACVVYQNHKSRSSRVERDVLQGCVIGLYFFLFSSMISVLFCLLPSAVLCYRPNHLVFLPLGSCCGGGHSSNFDSTGALVLASSQSEQR